MAYHRNAFPDQTNDAEKRERDRADDFAAALREQGFTVTTDWSTIQGSRTDGSFSMNGIRYVVEFKRRVGKADKFNTGMLEVGKYQALRAHYNAGSKVLYVFLFEDAAIVWNLGRIAPKIDDGRIRQTVQPGCPVTSFGRNREIVDKDVFMLPYSLAKRVALPPPTKATRKRADPDEWRKWQPVAERQDENAAGTPQ